MKVERVVALCLVSLLACNSVPPAKPAKRPDTVRYRLLLRENAVDPGEASRCFFACQSAATPNAYIDCLSECPGFETTPGEYCSNTEVPPVAACLTVRKIPAKSEPPPGMVVLEVVGGFALIVATASLCAVSNTQCGFYAFPPPK
jgi:hypothetical protein